MRKFSRFILSALIIMISLTTLFSCENEVIKEEAIEKKDEAGDTEKDPNKYDMDGGESKVFINMTMPWDDGKSLSSNHDNSYDHFLLSTTYLSNRRDGSTITGERKNYKIKAGDDGSRSNIDLGYFTQGKWRIDIKAQNSKHDTLYVGSWEGYVSASKPNAIMVSMEENSEDAGYIQLDCCSIAVPLPRVVVYANKVWNGTGETVLLDTNQDGKGLEITTDELGYAYYKTPKILMPAGAYWLKVQLWAGEDLFSGEVLDTFIVPRRETTISGIFTSTGLAEFIRVTPGQTLKFTDACKQLEIESGKMYTGFHLFGEENRVSFPYTNDTAQIKYLIPIIENITDRFQYVGGTLSATTPYPFKEVAFNHGYAESPIAIANGTFNGSSDLMAIYAPSIVTIGDDAFADTMLSDPLFGVIDSIGARAFKNTKINDLKDSGLANTVKIGAEAFRGSTIEFIDLPSGAKVGNYAFADCKKLNRAAAYMSEIPEGCFDGCSSLGYNPNGGHKSDKQLVFASALKTINDYAFRGCSSLESVKLPKDVTSIGKEAFAGCSGLIGTFEVPASVKSIGENAFLGTKNLKEVYINAVCGDLSGDPWGASNVVYWAYKLFFDSHLPADYTLAPGEDEFPMITVQNGSTLSSPIKDPRYRLVAYGDVIGATLDGYAIPIPVIDGYSLRGWYETIDGNKEVTQLTKNMKQQNWTVHAQWVHGLITAVFSGGIGGDNHTGKLAEGSETYRMLRYQKKYGIVAGEDVDDDSVDLIPLPTASIAGRDFIGWYQEPEQNLNAGNENLSEHFAPNEEYQKEIDALGKRVTVDTTVVTKKSHTLFAHYKDHRYNLKFDANLPTDKSYVTRNGHDVYGAKYNTPASYDVVYNQQFNRMWPKGKLSSPEYRGDYLPLPDLNDAEHHLDNYYFCGWYTSPECRRDERVLDTDYVPAQKANGDTIKLYAKWIGKEKLVHFYNKYRPDPTKDYVVEEIFKASAPEEPIYQRFTAKSRSTNEWRSYYNKKVTAGNEMLIQKDTRFEFPIPSREGYDFVGWWDGFYENEDVDSTEPDEWDTAGRQIYDGTDEQHPATEVEMPTEDAFYARWTPKTYHVKFDAKGGHFQDGSISKENPVVFHTRYGSQWINEEPVREGYVFMGWYNTREESEGYGFINSDAKCTEKSWVLQPSDHTMYAAWGEVVVTTVDDVNPTPSSLGSEQGKKIKVVFEPNEQGYYAATGKSDSNTKVVEIKAAWKQNPEGYEVKKGVWAPRKEIAPVKGEKITIYDAPTSTRAETGEMIELGLVRVDQQVITDKDGKARVKISTFGSKEYNKGSLPGKSIIYLTPEHKGDESNSAGVINIVLTGVLTDIDLRDVTTGKDLKDMIPKIYVRNETQIKAVLAASSKNEINKESKNGHLHHSNMGVRWEFERAPITNDGLPDMYTTVSGHQYDNEGLYQGLITMRPGEVLDVYNQAEGSVTLKAGYTIVSGKNAIKLKATGILSGVSISAYIEIIQPTTTIQVLPGYSCSEFLNDVETIYKTEPDLDTSVRPSKEWLITGFREWEGGDPYTAVSTIEAPKSPSGWKWDEKAVNTTGHTIYLFPIVDAVVDIETETGLEVDFRNKRYLAFPSNVRGIGKDSGNPESTYPDVTKVYIGGTGVSIFAEAFKNNGNAIEVRLGKTASITNVGNSAFEGAINVWFSNEESSKKFFTDITGIGNRAFYKAFNEGTVPKEIDLSKLENIGTYAFAESNVKNITNINVLNESAFQGCLKLESIKVSAAVIPRRAFSGCTALLSATLVNTTDIKGGAFYNCSKLGSSGIMSFPSTIKFIEDNMNYGGSYTGGAFENTALQSVNLSECSNLTEIGSYAFKANKDSGKMGMLYLPSGLKKVGSYAFCHQPIVQNLNLGYSCTSVGDYAFYDTLIPKVNFQCADSSVTVGAHAFASNEKLTTLVFGTKQRIVLGNYAFQGDSKLTAIDFYNMGSNFNASSFGTDVWDGCNIYIVKIQQSNFSEVINTNEDTQSWRMAPGGFKSSFTGNTKWGGWGAESWWSYSVVDSGKAAVASRSASKKHAWWKYDHQDCSFGEETHWFSEYSRVNPAVHASSSDGTCHIETYGIGKLPAKEWNLIVSCWEWRSFDEGSKDSPSTTGHLTQNLNKWCYPHKTDHWISSYKNQEYQDYNKW